MMDSTPSDFMAMALRLRPQLLYLHENAQALEESTGAGSDRALTVFMHALGSWQIAWTLGLAPSLRQAALLLPLFERALAGGPEAVRALENNLSPFFEPSALSQAQRALESIQADEPLDHELVARAASVFLDGTHEEHWGQLALVAVYHLQRGSLHDRADWASYAEHLGLLGVEGLFYQRRDEEYLARQLLELPEPPVVPLSGSYWLGIDPKTQRCAYAVSQGCVLPSFVRIFTPSGSRRFERDEVTVYSVEGLPMGFCALSSWLWRWNGQQLEWAGVDLSRSIWALFGPLAQQEEQVSCLLALLSLGAGPADPDRERIRNACARYFHCADLPQAAQYVLRAAQQKIEAFYLGAGYPAAEGWRLFLQAQRGSGALLEALAEQMQVSLPEAAATCLARFEQSAQQARVNFEAHLTEALNSQDAP